LTQLPEAHASAANVHLSAVEHKDSIVFLHAVQAGPASQSYGLQVAQLAGVPQPVIRAARKHLAVLEAYSVQSTPQFDLFSAPVNDPKSMFRTGNSPSTAMLVPCWMHWQRSIRTC